MACDRCGAPLEVVAGQNTAKCAFCHATQTVATGPARPAPNVPSFPFGPPPTSPFAPGRIDISQPMPLRATTDYARAQAIRTLIGGGVAIALLVGIGAFVAVRKGVNTLRGLNISSPSSLGLFDIGPAFPVHIDRAGIAGGPVDAARVAPSCRGHFPRLSHALIRVRQPSVLNVTTVSTGVDLTMAMHAPDGTFRCDDDSGEGTNPRIQGPFLPGDYHVWIGTYSDGASAPFTLSLDVQATGTAVMTNGIAPDVAPTLGVIDFAREPGGSQRPGMAIGSVEGSHVNPSCRGYVNVAPTATFTVAQPRFVSITTTGSTDLTLLVRGPSGLITCDDDSGDGANPRIDALDGPGAYQLWVGPYSQTHSAASYVLSVVSDPMLTAPEPNGLSPSTPPVFGTVDLDTNGTEQSYRGVIVGRIEGNGIDSSCGARFLAAPHLALHTMSARRVQIAASSDHEVNVLMRSPDGTERCISGVRRAANEIDGSVQLTAGESQFWVGTWERERHVSFLLTVTPAATLPTGPRPQRGHRGTSM